MWSWLERPDNRLCLARFGAGMAGSRHMTEQEALLSGLSFFLCCSPPNYVSKIGYEWGKLSLDVGGGVGSLLLTLAHRYPNLCFVVQDREAVVADANEVCRADASFTQFCKKSMPEALDSGRVKLQGLSYSIPAFFRDDR